MSQCFVFRISAKEAIYKVYILAVWRDTYPTRLGSRERDETRLFDFFFTKNSLLFNWKKQNAQKVNFEINLYFMKSNLFFLLYAVITTCKLELHDSVWIENHSFFYKLEITIF